MLYHLNNLLPVRAYQPLGFPQSQSIGCPRKATCEHHHHQNLESHALVYKPYRVDDGPFNCNKH
jgi:hypothetical protein